MCFYQEDDENPSVIGFFDLTTNSDEKDIFLEVSIMNNTTIHNLNKHLIYLDCPE